MTGKNRVFLYTTDEQKLEVLNIPEIFPSIESKLVTDFRVLQNGELYFEVSYAGVIVSDRKHNIIKLFNDESRSYFGQIVGLGDSYYSFIIKDGVYSRPSDMDFHLETIRLDAWKINEIKSFGYDIYENAFHWLQPKHRFINFGDSLVIYNSMHRYFVKAFDPISGDYIYRTKYKPSYFQGIDTLGIYSQKEGLRGKANFLSNNKETTYSQGIYRLNDDTYYIIYTGQSKENHERGYRTYGVELFSYDGSRILDTDEEIFVEEPLQGSYRNSFIGLQSPLLSNGDNLMYRLISKNDEPYSERNNLKFAGENPDIEVWQFKK